LFDTISGLAVDEGMILLGEGTSARHPCLSPAAHLGRPSFQDAAFPSLTVAKPWRSRSSHLKCAIRSARAHLPFIADAEADINEGRGAVDLFGITDSGTSSE
jgi:hypothetical protein